MNESEVVKMRITDLLDKRSISLTGNPKTKSEALDQIVDLMVKSGKINDREAYRRQVYAREEESTTGVGEGIAIPHGKCDAVDKPGLAAMVIKDGVDFDALDGKPVTLMFLIAAPNTKDNVHLDVLSKLSVLMMDEDFANNLRNAKTVDEFLSIIDKALPTQTLLPKTALSYWQSPPALPASLIPIWRRKDLRKLQKQRIALSKWRQEDPAERKTYSQLMRSRTQTASSWPPTRRFPWTGLTERKLLSARYLTVSAKRTS